jgi:hypothetical protein
MSPTSALVVPKQVVPGTIFSYRYVFGHIVELARWDDNYDPSDFDSCVALIAGSSNAGLTVRLAQICGKLKSVIDLLEWRNWQTHGTQNPATFTGHVGSTPTSSTIYFSIT